METVHETVVEIVNETIVEIVEIVNEIMKKNVLEIMNGIMK